MPTIGEALAERDRRLFVGRERELAAFRSWLAGRHSPTMLVVTGPGGIGKSTLIRAFARDIQSAGTPALLVDGRVVEPSPQAFVSALGAGSPAEAADRLAAAVDPHRWDGPRVLRAHRHDRNPLRPARAACLARPRHLRLPGGHRRHHPGSGRSGSRAARRGVSGGPGRAPDLRTARS